MASKVLLYKFLLLAFSMYSQENVPFVDGKIWECNSTCQENLNIPSRVICAERSTFNGRSCQCINPFVSKLGPAGVKECLERCGPGAYHSNFTGMCERCPHGTFKSFDGDKLEDCQACPTDSESIVNDTTVCACRDPWKSFNTTMGLCTCPDEMLGIPLSDKKNNWAGLILRSKNGILTEESTNTLYSGIGTIFETPYSNIVISKLEAEMLFPLKARGPLPVVWNDGRINWNTTDNLIPGRYLFKLQVRSSCGVISEPYFLLEIQVFEFSLFNRLDELTDLVESTRINFNWTMFGIDFAQDSVEVEFGLSQENKASSLQYYLGSTTMPGLFSWVVPFISRSMKLSLVVSWKISFFSIANNFTDELRRSTKTGTITSLRALTFEASRSISVFVSNTFSSCKRPNSVSNSVVENINISMSCEPIFQKRHVGCRNKVTGIELPLPFCDHAGLEIPTSYRECIPDDCSWSVSEWSKCSKSCGGGIRTRKLICSNRATNCSHIPPSLQQLALEQRCNEFICETPTVTVSKADSTGIVDIQSCVDSSTGKILLPTKCVDDGTPYTLNPIEYEYNDTEWIVSTWGKCNKVCGYGIMEREVMCKLGKESRCLSRKPESTRVCNSFPCESYAIFSHKCVNESYAEVDMHHCEESGPETIKIPQGTLWLDTEENKPSSPERRVFLSEEVEKMLGEYCGVPGSVLDSDGNCCLSGVRDYKSACCESGRLDVCGICDGNNKFVDVSGSCCPTVLDAGGICCSSGRLDRCGVCDGDGSTCVTLITGVTKKSSIYKDIKSHLLSSSKQRILQNDDSSLEVKATGITDSALHNIIVLANASSREALFFEINGVCGNGVCETGEICSAGSSELDGSCCSVDCPFPIAPCRADCLGAGKCVPTTGECDCFLASGAVNFPDTSVCDVSQCRDGYIYSQFGCIPQDRLQQLPAICPNGKLIVSPETNLVNCSLEPETPGVFRPRSPEDMDKMTIVIATSVVSAVLLIVFGAMYFRSKIRAKTGESASRAVAHHRQQPKLGWEKDTSSALSFAILEENSCSRSRFGDTSNDSENDSSEESMACDNQLKVTIEHSKTRERKITKAVESGESIIAAPCLDNARRSRKLSEEKVVAETWAKLQVKSGSGSKSSKEYYFVFHGVYNEIRYYTQMVPSAYGNVFVSHKGSIPICNIRCITLSKTKSSRIKITMNNSNVKLKIKFDDEESATYWRMIINTALLQMEQQEQEKEAAEAEEGKVSSQPPPIPPYSKQVKHKKLLTYSSSQAAAVEQFEQLESFQPENSRNGKNNRNNLDSDSLIVDVHRGQRHRLSNHAFKSPAIPPIITQSPSESIWSNFQNTLNDNTHSKACNEDQSNNDIDDYI